MADIIYKVDKENDARFVRDIIKYEIKISSGLLTKLKKSGGIKLNDKTVNVSVRVNVGDVLSIEFPKENSSSIEPVNIPLDIIYEDKFLLAVNKPKDMPTHPSAGNRDNTLGNACMYYYRNTGFVYRPVTRLDRDTTGIVLVAKDSRTASLLSEQMQKGNFNKTYYAITQGIPSPSSGTISAPIGRVDGSILKREVRSDGQPAITKYTVIATKDTNALVHINLLTGRTHQIRVHFSHIGCPLLYDYMYGTEIPGETLYLHCGEISFIHPITENLMTLKAKPIFPLFNEYLGAY